MTNITQGEFDFNPIPSKACYTCGQVLPLTEFQPRKGAADGHRGECKACRKVRLARNYQAKIDERRTKNRAYSAAHKAEQAARGRKFYDANRDLALERAHEHYLAHRDEALQRSKEWLINNRERHYANTRRRAARIPHVIKAERTAASHAKRATKRGLIGRWTGQEWLTLKEKYGNKCLCCGKQEPEVKLTPDMVIPFAKGGANTLENIQVLCLDCNDRKGRKIIDYRPEER